MFFWLIYVLLLLCKPDISCSTYCVTLALVKHYGMLGNKRQTDTYQRLLTRI